MFSRHKTKAVVINKKDRGEFDRALTLYTEKFGKISLFCKSIRKERSKLRSGSEPFAIIETEFIEGRTRRTMTDVKVVNSYPKINGDLVRISLTTKILEDIDSLIQGEQKDVKVWRLIGESLNMVEEGKGSVVYHRFFWKLVSALGYGPELYVCSRCRGKIDPAFLILSPVDGGLICSNCKTEKSFFSVDEGTVKAIRISLRNDRFFERVKLRPAEEELLADVSQKYLSMIR